MNLENTVQGLKVIKKTFHFSLMVFKDSKRNSNPIPQQYLNALSHCSLSLTSVSCSFSSPFSLQKASLLSGAERSSVEEGTPQSKTLGRNHVLYSWEFCSGSHVRPTWGIFSVLRMGFAQSFPSLCFFPFQPTGSCTCSI